jgi:dihydroxyacetone kinase-like protein
VIAAAQKAIDNTRSVGIGTRRVPFRRSDTPISRLRKDDGTWAIGHHGEPGVSDSPLATAVIEIAEQMLRMNLRILPVRLAQGDRVGRLLSGLGATTALWNSIIVYRRVEEILTEQGIRVHRAYGRNYFTSLEMMGVTLTVMKLGRRV